MNRPDDPTSESSSESAGEPAAIDEWLRYGTLPGEPRPRPGVLEWIALGLVLLVVLGMVLLWPRGDDRDRYREELEAFGVPSELHAAEVALVEAGPCEFAPDAECVRVEFLLQEGPDAGDTFVQQFPESPTTPEFSVGETVVLAAIPGGSEGFEYQFQDRQRRGVLLWVTIAFIVAVAALGSWRGLAAVAGLAASIGVLLLFVLPAILEGSDPVLVAVVGAAAVAYLALYLSHGFRRMTTVALLGTLASLALTALLSWLVLELARFSGFSTEESLFLSLLEGIDIRGLVLAGIVFGAAGAVDDVTVTQASAVWELRRANPSLTATDLTRAGLRIGRDHIASTVNTLLLAYAGASLPLLVLFVLSSQSLGSIANSEIVAVEIIRTLVGSIGLVAAVPITTWMAAWAATSLDPAGTAETA